MAKAKSKKLRMAIIGCGGMAGAHARRYISNPDVAIVACCDLTEEIADHYINTQLAKVNPRPVIYTDLAKMYRESNLDAVTIVTPHTLHFEQGMQALKAGCHVLMEKPMVTSATQAYQLDRMVKASKKILVIGYNTPCTPEFAYLRELVRTQGLGKLELVIGYLSQNWMKGTVGKWRQDPALSGGGQAYDSGAHLLNSLVWTVESDITEVFAFVDNHGTPVDINSSINIRFANGVLASIVVGGNCPADGAAMHLLFDDGRVEVDGWGGSWINVFKGNQKVKYPPISGTAQTPNDNFIDAILKRAKPRTSPANGIVQSELMDAIYESARTGRPARPKLKK